MSNLPSGPSGGPLILACDVAGGPVTFAFYSGPLIAHWVLTPRGARGWEGYVGETQPPQFPPEALVAAPVFDWSVVVFIPDAQEDGFVSLDVRQGDSSLGGAPAKVPFSGVARDAVTVRGSLVFKKAGT